MARRAGVIGPISPHHGTGRSLDDPLATREDERSPKGGALHMNLRRLAVLGLAALLLNTVGCKTDEQGADAANPITPVISASATSVSAVPTSSVTITVSAGRAPV